MCLVSSVDSERASGERFMLKHPQRSMGEHPLEAKMAIGSWFQTSLLPSLHTAAAILADKVRLHYIEHVKFLGNVMWTTVPAACATGSLRVAS